MSDRFGDGPGPISDAVLGEIEAVWHSNPDGSEVKVPASTKIGKGVCLRDNIKLGDNVTIEDGVIIGDSVEIGQNTVIHAGSILSEGSAIGFDCIIGKNVYIRPWAEVPSRWQLRDEAVANPHPGGGPAHIH